MRRALWVDSRTLFNGLIQSASVDRSFYIAIKVRRRSYRISPFHGMPKNASAAATHNLLVTKTIRRRHHIMLSALSVLQAGSFARYRRTRPIVHSTTFIEYSVKHPMPSTDSILMGYGIVILEGESRSQHYPNRQSFAPSMRFARMFIQCPVG